MVPFLGHPPLDCWVAVAGCRAVECGAHASGPLALCRLQRGRCRAGRVSAPHSQVSEAEASTPTPGALPLRTSLPAPCCDLHRCPLRIPHRPGTPTAFSGHICSLICNSLPWSLSPFTPCRVQAHYLESSLTLALLASSGLIQGLHRGHRITKSCPGFLRWGFLRLSSAPGSLQTSQGLGSVSCVPTSATLCRSGRGDAGFRLPSFSPPTPRSKVSEVRLSPRPCRSAFRGVPSDKQGPSSC